eukprot:CAMPEP_0174957112 /NCGR_PEP_ID=MMETSP0004_2-20121128/1898_1 /TAXON_ID=420556 /ORGANISM="Ochromonas sp., Strain CCMP1393" /LENGTH=229 /DNA_ID=CAMNT_0016205199 /DNA_START=114 /DNA_END=803 /DNA_ORIENTATION=-
MTRIYSSEEIPEETFEVVAEEEAAPVPAVAVPVAAGPVPAKWLPIGGVKAPKLLDGSLPGDAGFDPLGLSRSKNGLYWMREAEIKHGRLAMLAAVGWPISELWHKGIANTLGWESILANGDRAPSLLNGGLSNNWATFALMASIIAGGLLEGKAMNSGEIFWSSEKSESYVPGDLGFDPLNLYNVRGDKKAMEETEIKNGRLAMIAITAYAFQEFATKIPVVQETPYLF